MNVFGKKWIFSIKSFAAAVDDDDGGQYFIDKVVGERRKR